MKILQRILSKGILITLAIAAGLAYYYRADLFPQWHPETAQKQDSSTVSTNEPTTIEPAVTPMEATAPAVMAPSVDPVLPPAEESSADVTEPVTDEKPAQDENLPDSGAPADDPATTENMPSTLPASTEGTATTTKPPVANMEVQSAVSENPEAIDSVPETVADDVTIPIANAEQLLSQARSAFWQKDHARAEEIYQQAAKLDSQNPDIYGELGNLYFSQGKWQQAADAYYAAGSRLAEQGNSDRVRHLVTVLKGLDSVQAEKLEKTIAQ